jgi:divalent metal cation (Fe/Co/Zn/Cd) transporter
MLFFIPLSGLVLWIVRGQLSFLVAGMLLFVGTFSLYQAYCGIIKRDVRLLPPRRSAKLGAHPFGRAKEKATGRGAVVAGFLFAAVGTLCLLLGVRMLL